MGIVFLSDVHLGANEDLENTAREDKLIKFFKNEVVKYKKLIINGDLFDFWFEYKTVIPKGYLKILSGLLYLKDNGVEIDYVAGNHDFWLSEYLTKELGICIHMDEYTFEHDNKKFWVYHGDGIAQKDRGYRFLKRILRNRINIRLFRLLHPDLGIPLAKFVSHGSRKQSYKKDLNDEHDYENYAKKILDSGYHYVILGHRHEPFEMIYNRKKYINLGDWINHFSYAVFNDNKLTLKYWEQ